MAKFQGFNGWMKNAAKNSWIYLIIEDTSTIPQSDDFYLPSEMANCLKIRAR